MIRLAVPSTEEALWREIAPRLRGAVLETASDTRGPSLPEACAVVFLGPSQPDPAALQGLLEAGQHVLLATEAYLTSDELEDLFDVAQQANVRLAVVNPDRYLPSRQLIRQQLDAGKLGEAVLVRSHRWEPVASSDRLDASPIPGPLLRDLELALGLLGKQPNRVYALVRAANESTALHGRYIQSHLGFPGGGMALIDYANRLPPGDAYRSLTVIGSAGAAYADDHQNLQLVYRGGHPQAVRTEEGPRQLAALVQEFVDALHAGHDTPGDMATWRAAWTVAAALRRSIETGQAIALGDG